jgi:hypothetical protein
MSSIDYGKNLAAEMGIPGINVSETTSAMTQMQFQNIRNLGANGNQPLITNQNDFQIFDNITWIKGKHTLKMGGSVTFRSREILNADSIVGQFAFNNNMTSNCAGVAVGCTVNSGTGFDVASFLLGYATTKTRNLFDSKPYIEKRPEYALYVQDDFRVNSKLTLNLGVRYEVYVPWVEVDDKQSNFDVITGQFVPVATCRPTPRVTSAPVSASPTTCSATRVRSCEEESVSSGTSLRVAPPLRRRRIPRSSSPPPSRPRPIPTSRRASRSRTASRLLQVST